MSAPVGGPHGHWAAAEDAALHELPWAAQLIYLRGLRRFMDADSGVVGIRRRISRRALVELLTVPDKRGRHNAREVAPTEGMVRHALGVLRDAGLICSVPGYESTLVFRLPMALQDKSVSGMSNRMSDRVNDPMSNRGADHTEAFSDAGFGDLDAGMSDRISDPMSHPMSNPPQSKDLPLGNSTQEHRPTSRVCVTRLGALCRRLRHEASMLDAHPQRPELRQAIADDLDVEVLVSTAKELKRQREMPPGVAYLIATVRGRMRDAQQLQGKSNAVSRGSRASVCDGIEQQDREASARERRAAFCVIG